MIAAVAQEQKTAAGDASSDRFEEWLPGLYDLPTIRFALPRSLRRRESYLALSDGQVVSFYGIVDIVRKGYESDPFRAFDIPRRAWRRSGCSA